MATHASLTGSELHEPKAIAAAVAGTVYVADGLGSGAWSQQAGAGVKLVSISEEADFPDPVSGVITLDANTEYKLTDDISTANRFVFQANTVVSGSDILIGMFEYTGTGDFITAVDATIKVKNVQLRYLSANQCFNVSNSGGNEGTDTLIIDRVSFVGTSLGVLTSLANVQVLQTSFSLLSTGGFTLTGTNWTSANFAGFTANLAAGTLFDIGTTTFDRFSCAQFSVDVGSGTTFLSGTTGSGNINAGGDGSIVLGRFNGAGGTILNNITEEDARWSFALNDDLADSRTDGLLSMQANATNTAIVTQSVGVLVAGTWVVEDTSRMTGTTAGRLTYDGLRDAKLPITSAVTIEPVSGGAQLMGCAVAVNGSMVANSLRTGTASPGSPASITVPWQDTLSSTDFVELFVTNEAGTTDVLVSSAVHRMN